MQNNQPLTIPSFIKSLEKKPSDDLFNPWYERDPHHDELTDAPGIRRAQLQYYLTERLHSAKYLMIAEALGYQGGHFTGIAMTSERILMGHQSAKYGIEPRHVFTSVPPRRTSRKEVSEKGMTEPTATIMWGALTDLEMDPYEVVLWNAVPWHPYKKEKGLLSNRTPTSQEMDAGLGYLQSFIRLFNDVEVVAVGRKCEASLSELGKTFTAVRHPANGGAPTFRKQLKDMIRRR